MPRYRLDIEYDGRPYHGYQAQVGLPSVQASLQRAIAGFSGETRVIYAAGRTDTGVHASRQVIHFELEKPWKPAVVRDAVNAHLVPEPIAVLDAVEVDEDFHARHSARARRYLFRILNRRAPPTFDRGRVWHQKKPLDAEAMNVAAQVLVGHHDFTTFRDAQCQANSPMRTMDQASVWRVGDEVHLGFVARSFLHRQVRSMTGTLAEVGLGRWDAARLKAALEAADRSACGPVAPPDGLYLAGVDY